MRKLHGFVSVFIPALFICLFSVVGIGQQQPHSAPLMNSDVLDLVKANISADVIVAKIKSSDCRFDTSPGTLKGLKDAGVPDNVVLAMIEAPPAPEYIASPVEEHQAQVSDEIQAERTKRDAECPKCKFILISNVDSANGNVTDDWMTKNQRDYMIRRHEEVKNGKLPRQFWYTKHRENADYIFFWTAAQGFRPYVVYVPHTETSTANISGTSNSYGSNGYQSGSFNGTVQVNRTYYQAQTNQHQFVDVVVTVYDRFGKKTYETWHQGNFRWSKPDKDCLDEALKYLGSLNQ
ncbi:MAG TPA: hypothetical protein VJW20_07370 [Candidatus Angelobacter sp.]|nr:hypothetical protein [Candidatus Angelobacter sp.]